LRVESVNAAFCRTFRVTESEAMGQFIFDLCGGQWDIPGLRTRLEQITEVGAFEDFEVDQNFKRLGLRKMLLNARHVLSDDDGASMILLAIEDETDKLMALDALYKLNRDLEVRVQARTAALETANRELEAFCYSVSHDLRAPLRALDGFSDELLRSYADKFDDRGRQYLERVRAGTQRMGQLIDDLLQLSKHSRGEMKRESVELSTIALSVADELRQREPDRKISLEVQDGLDCQGDPGLLRVVLENLLANAWKFTGKNPTAAITVGKTEHQGKPAFFVRDDGAGFDMNHSAKLFGAFQRLHLQREFPGTGIGLATVQRIIHRHSGKVWAASAPGEGATFYFTLPAKEAL
jgi:light-regulated signal transduction histidine kinase (bacteriophytochrome)